MASIAGIAAMFLLFLLIRIGVTMDRNTTIVLAILIVSVALVFGTQMWIDRDRPRMEVAPSEGCVDAYIQCIKNANPNSCANSVVEAGICPASTAEALP